MYIGVTSNLRERKKQHSVCGYFYPKLHEFYWQQARPDTTADALIGAEVKQIYKHQPPHCRTIGANGPMRAAIDRQLEKLRLASAPKLDVPIAPDELDKKIAFASEAIEPGNLDNDQWRVAGQQLPTSAQQG
jgi:hypothetical protein